MANFQKTLKELEQCCEALFDKLDDPQERIARRLIIRRCNDILMEIYERRHPEVEPPVELALVPVKHGKFTCPRCNYPIDSQNDNNFNPEHTWIQCPDCGYRQTTNLFF